MNSGHSSRSTSKAGRAGDDAVSRNPGRREKARSAQAYSQQQQQQSAPSSRRGSLKPADPEGPKRSAAQRPTMGARTKSAPVAELLGAPAKSTPTTTAPVSRYASGESDRRDNENRAALRQNFSAVISNRLYGAGGGGGGRGGGGGGADEDELMGATGGSARHNHMHDGAGFDERLPEISIAVIGADGVGKSTFTQKALDLPYPAPAPIVERVLTYENLVYMVRFLEIPIGDVEIDDDDDTVCWPDVVGDRMTPRIDGALTLYDVKDKSSLEQVPEVLTALSKASLPSILISCKCDVAPTDRDLDPVAIEEKAKRSVRNLMTLQTSNATSDNHKRGIVMMLKATTPAVAAESAVTNRRRAQSNAVRTASPRPSGLKGHARATSEFNGSLRREKSHTRHDSSLAGHASGERAKPSGGGGGGMQRSFLFEESGTDSSADTSETSTTAESSMPAATVPLSVTALSENGATFDELVDRLLAQPMSKADGKFGAVFLALYRKFAAPGRLLEAVVDRFDGVDHSTKPELTKTSTQLRYLAVLEQWMCDYPGDFAFPKMKRRIQTFVTKMVTIPVFSAAAKEMSADLEMVREDDDTNWAYNDRDRESYHNATERWTMSSTAGPLLDDISFLLPDNLSGLTVTDDVGIAASLGGDNIRSTSASSTNSSHPSLAVDAAQRQAQLLEPRPRLSLSKAEWRMLMDLPDDLVAKELTRMDWVMFASIRPRDLVRHVSLTGPDKAACKSLVNVDRMVSHFNQLAACASNFILLRDKPKHRAMMLEKFMRVARKLRELNNYNSLGAIIAGVKSSAVHRLQTTRELIPASIGKDWMKLEILMSPSRSHAAYRLAWENSSGERIPYIPLHRRDLVSAEEGNKTFAGSEDDGKINWKKFEIMGEVIVSLQRAQDLPYPGLAGWRGGEQARELVLEVKLVKDEEELYERSIQCEASAGSGGGTSARFKEFFKR